MLAINIGHHQWKIFLNDNVINNLIITVTQDTVAHYQNNFFICPVFVNITLTRMQPTRMLMIHLDYKSIKNEEPKQHVKFWIQSLLFSSLSSRPIPTFPTPIHVPGAQAIHSQWDHSCSSPPTDGWHQRISLYGSFK